MDDQFVDDRVREHGVRQFPVTGGPRVPHWLEGVATTEPAMEFGVGVDGQVRRDHSTADHACDVGVGRGNHEETRGDDLVGADFVAALRDISGTEPVEDRAIGLSAGETQHPGAKRAEEQGRSHRDGAREFEAVDLEGLVDVIDLLAIEGALDEIEHVARARVGLLVGHAVPALDDRFTRGS